MKHWVKIRELWQREIWLKFGVQNCKHMVTCKGGCAEDILKRLFKVESLAELVVLESEEHGGEKEYYVCYNDSIRECADSGVYQVSFVDGALDRVKRFRTAAKFARAMNF